MSPSKRQGRRDPTLTGRSRAARSGAAEAGSEAERPRPRTSGAAEAGSEAERPRPRTSGAAEAGSEAERPRPRTCRAVREDETGEVVYLEAEPPAAELARRRKAPPPLPRFRRRTIEVDLAQIEEEERLLPGRSQADLPLPPVDSPEESFFAPCQDGLAGQLRSLLAAVGEGGTIREICGRSGLELAAVQLGLEILSAAGLIERVREPRGR